MRRAIIINAAFALFIGAATAAIGGGALAAEAGAETLPAPAAQDAPAVVMPSCSLHPDRLSDGTVTLTNAGTERRFLQVIGEDGSILWNRDLEVGESTPPLHLGPAAFIGWGDPGYPLSAYALRGWCGEGAVTTTAAPPPTTLAPPPSTTVAPPPTTVAPPSTTIPAAPPVSEPPISCLDERCETLTAVETGVEASSAQRGPLPTTGGHPGVPALIAASLMLLGAAAVTASRSRRLAR